MVHNRTTNLRNLAAQFFLGIALALQLHREDTL